MKKIVLVQLWGMMISWSLFLNGQDIMAIAMMLTQALFLLLVEGEVDYWRIIALCVTSYAILAGLLFSGEIPYYFPHLHIFLAANILDGALLGECFYSYKKGLAISFSIMESGFMILLGIVIALFAKGEHSIFGKGNLLLMDLFIFLPQLLPAMVCAIEKTVHFSKTVHMKKAA